MITSCANLFDTILTQTFYSKDIQEIVENTDMYDLFQFKIINFTGPCWSMKVTSTLT